MAAEICADKGWPVPSKLKRNLFLICALAGIAVLARACLWRPATDWPGAHFNRGRNAAWLGVEWVMEPRAAAEIASLADELKRRHIRSVYVFSSYLKPHGEFNPTYAHAANFTAALKARYPEANIQAWIGLPLRQPRPLNKGYVDLTKASVRGQVAAFCGGLVREQGFDGIHLDPEPIPSGDRQVLALLDEVREAIGPEATLSIATSRIWPILPQVSWPLVRQVAWTSGYYREVARRVDQMAVMLYDSTLPLPILYRQWCRFETIKLSRALKGTGVELLLGVPTSEEATWTHHPWAENMESGLRGIIAGLNDRAATPETVTGVAIYPYWETGVGEWAIYESQWLGLD